MRLSVLQLLIILVISTTVLASISFKHVYAHPILLESQPANLARLNNAPTEVRMRFSEAVEIGFSRVEVLDSSGNRVDNNDLAYDDGDELRLKVTLKPLQDDIYIVKTRVLSKVDGHVVDYTTIFAVGNVELKVEDTPTLSSKEIVLLPESMARFPGMVGQSIMLGSGIVAVLLLAKRHSDYTAVAMHDSRLRMLLTIAVAAVIASGIAMISVNTVRLESSIVDALTNRYGTIVLVRLGLALILLAVLAVKSRYTAYTSIAIGAVLIATNSLLSHSAGLAEPVLPTIADFVHNIVASVWVGGLLYMAYTLLPSSRAEAPLALIMIPRFSSMIVVCLAIASITGTFMLFAIESNTATLLSSTYGMLLLIKLGIVGVMTGFGAYNQLLHRKGMGMLITSEKGAGTTTTAVAVGGTFNMVFAKSVRVESIIGLALMLVISMIVNTVPPEGESIKLLAVQPIGNGSDGVGVAVGVGGDATNRLTGYWLDDQVRIVLSIEPAMLGENRFNIMLTAPDGISTLADVSSVRLKASMPREGIAPVEYQATPVGNGRYTGSITFPTYGSWTVEVLASRERALNIAVPMEFNLKPRLDDLELEVVEYAMPVSNAKPYHLVVDGRMLWISDVGGARVWLFNMDSKEFKEYRIDGINLVTILSRDASGRVWFVDPSSSKFGYVARDGSYRLYDAPDGARLSYIMADSKGMVWLALLDKDAVASFNVRDGTFKVYALPTKESFPIALLEDDLGNIWVAESIAGKIARIEPESMDVKEYMPKEPLKEPTALMLDSNGNIWIAEHLGNRVIMFNPILERFTAYNANDSKALPFGLAEDRYGNVWFAQHVVPKIGVLDPSTGRVRDVEIPTSNPFNQWLTIDGNSVWFAEPEGNKIGSIAIKARPTLAVPLEDRIQTDGKQEEKVATFRLVDAATPILTSIIVIASLLFAKGVNDYRRVKNVLTGK
ncbi:MAG: copper resistance protein CopC [Candidatus Nitrosocaldus sp.]